MLAKLWKKVLLAVCIIACIYNVMGKLISRTSLEMQLKSVQNQASLLDFFKDDNKQDNEENITNSQNSQTEEKTILQEEKDTINKDDDNTIVVIY